MSSNAVVKQGKALVARHLFPPLPQRLLTYWHRHPALEAFEGEEKATTLKSSSLCSPRQTCTAVHSSTESSTLPPPTHESCAPKNQLIVTPTQNLDQGTSRKSSSNSSLQSKSTLHDREAWIQKPETADNTVSSRRLQTNVPHQATESEYHWVQGGYL